jgi:hypothetical protein
VGKPGVARPSADEARRVKLKPHDSFDLIRLLARSQSDARKAVGELVQNSLDANARRVEVHWFNEKGARCLRIHDDGEGIFPGEERPAALQKIAQTIGYSHKLSLTPLERREQMTLGKYGIGLLGFWCVARTMDVSSRVGGGETWVLRLREGEPEAEMFRARSQRVHDEATFTEIVLREVKDSVARQVRPARLQAYLAAELRGQLLQRGVEVKIHDRIARGRAVKEFVVRPRAYLGVPLDEPRTLAVPGHEDARLELYYVPPDEGRRGVVALACGGSTVLDDIALVDLTDPSGATRAPWNSGLFEGVVDFPELDVAPGTRRGFVPNDAALDFLIALEHLERHLAARIESEAAARAAQHRENVAREIRRAFAAVARALPQYDLFDVRAAAQAEAGAESTSSGDGAALGPGPDESATPSDEFPPVETETAGSLFPPGPLASVRLSPARVRVAPSTSRRVRALALDADGRAAAGDPTFEWRLEGPGELDVAGAEATYLAPDAEADGSIHVLARDGERVATARADVQVREAVDRARAAGIPEPLGVNAPSEPWRSRIRDNRWEYNEGHRDYAAVRGDDARRLRYLCHLFAKEVVLRNFGDGGADDVLERMVEVLTHLGDARVR